MVVGSEQGHLSDMKHRSLNMPPEGARRDPLVSILLPTYNRVELLRRAVKSIQQQTLADWELLVVNDASTDGTRDFLDKAAGDDPRVRPIHNEKNNYPDISANLNKGMRQARGAYIARLDDDDMWCDREKLAKQVAFLETHAACVVVGGGTIVVDADDKEQFRYHKPETDDAIRRVALFANPFTHSTVLFRRDIALAVGGYGDYQNAEDWDLWLRMGMRGELHNLQEYFVRYLMTDTNKTFLHKRSQSRELLRIVYTHRDEYPGWLGAYIVSMAQYAYSLLPYALRRILHGTLSHLKRSVFSRPTGAQRQ